MKKKTVVKRRINGSTSFQQENETVPMDDLNLSAFQALNTHLIKW